MSTLPEYEFDKASLLKEVGEFVNLLATQQKLAEQAVVLPFFKQRLHLSAFIAVSMAGIQTADLLKHEFKIASKFAADLVIGDSKKNTFFFVEFEDGKPDGILHATKGKSTKKWTPRFEHAFGQVIDWFSVLEDIRHTNEFTDPFGSKDAQYGGLLVIGRSANLTPHDLRRIEWRSRSVMVNGKPVMCRTYDQLLESIQLQVEAFEAWA